MMCSHIFFSVSCRSLMKKNHFHTIYFKNSHALCPCPEPMQCHSGRSQRTHSRKEHIGLDSHHSTWVNSPDKLSDHDIVSGTLKIFIPPIKKPRRKVYPYQKGDYESMRKDTLEFAKEKYFMVTRILVRYRRTLTC